MKFFIYPLSLSLSRRVQIMKTYLEVKWNVVARRLDPNGSLDYFRADSRRKSGPGLEISSEIFRHVSCPTTIPQSSSSSFINSVMTMTHI